MNDLPVTHKFVAVLNKKIAPNLLMNALGHMAAGLSASYANKDDMRFDSYFDKDSGEHKSISDNPFIVLKAKNSNQLRTLRERLIDENIHFVDFTDTMTVGTFAEQKDRTKNTSEEDLEYYGVCIFGPIAQINSLTKKYSLWQ